jgi:hypothetical protein
MNKFQTLAMSLLIVLSMGLFQSCKKTFDGPPAPGDVDLVANTSIQALKTYHVVPGVFDMINEDVIISGIVVANDKSGNFYKQLFIQDTTGAIQLLIDASSTFTSFPVGRRVYVKCKGLTLTDSYGNLVLGVKAIIDGLPSIEGIPGALVSKYLIGGSLNNPVTPLEVSINDLGTSMNNRYINALVKLTGYEFAASDTLKTYSDTSSYKATTNRLITTGCGNTISLTIRTSGYANFAGVRLPSGNGSITAVYTVYKSSPTSNTTTKQMIIRDTSDVQFDSARCGAPPPGTILLINEDFETQNASTVAPYTPVSINGWLNVAQDFTRSFDARIFSNNKYAYLSAFGTNAPAVTGWLVTKAINMNGTNSEVLTFDTKQDFYLTAVPNGTPVPSALKVLVSTNFSGTGNPWAAGVNWTDITSQAALSEGSTTSNYPSTYTGSGNIDLSSYTGTIYIAFRYEGADLTGTANDKTSAWEVDNIRVTGIQ